MDISQRDELYKFLLEQQKAQPRREMQEQKLFDDRQTRSGFSEALTKLASAYSGQEPDVSGYRETQSKTFTPSKPKDYTSDLVTLSKPAGKKLIPGFTHGSSGQPVYEGDEMTGVIPATSFNQAQALANKPSEKPEFMLSDTYTAPDKKPVYTIKGETGFYDADKRMVKDVVQAEPKLPASVAAQQAKSENETTSRYNILKNNASNLKALVSKHGTSEVMGTAGADMDRLIYEMAIDYAKLVDPDSVAREGEVAAAQKYMLPIRNYGGLAYTNKNAMKLIESYQKALDDRLKARGMDPEATAKKAFASELETSSGKSLGTHKKEVKRQHNKQLNKTRVFYSDGTQEVIDGIK